MIGLLYECVCEIDIAMLFLILASKTMMVVEEDEKNFKTKLSSCQV